MLSHVVKDWPYSMEVDRAQQGLISLLKIPGPGLEKGSTQELTIFNNYLDKKSAFISHRIKKNITDAFKNKPFNIKERITVSDKINKVQHANNQHEIRRYAKELAKIIDKASLETKVKNELKDMSRQLMDWRFFEAYRWKMESAREALASLASHQDKLSELFLGLSNTQDLGQAQELMSKIENEKISLASQSDYRDFINNLKEALDLKIEMLVADESIRLKDKIGAPDLTEDKRRKLQNAVDDIEATQNYEELLVFQENIKNKQPDLYQDIEELLEADNYLIVSEEEKNLADLKEEQRQKDEVLKQRDLHRIKYKAIIRGALSLLPGLIVFLLLSLILSFFVLCFITERRRRRIICLYQNPREFIIGLYENLKYILGLLGLGYNKTSAPLAYAHMVEERYKLKDSLVLKLTAKFEEAKYSKHNLGANDASLVLTDYNSLVKILFKSHSKIFVFFKYLILLLYTRPVFIARNLR